MKHEKLKKTADKINIGFILFSMFAVLTLVESIGSYYTFKNNERVVSKSIYLMQLVRNSSDDLTLLFFNRALMQSGVLKDDDLDKTQRASAHIKGIRDGKLPWPKNYSEFLADYAETGVYKQSKITKPLHQRIKNDGVMSETTKHHYLRALEFSDELFEIEETASSIDMEDKNETSVLFEQYYALKTKIVAEVGKANTLAKDDISMLWRKMLREEMIKLFIGFVILTVFVYRGYRYQAAIKRELVSDFDTIEDTIQRFKANEEIGHAANKRFYYDELYEINELLVDTADEKQRLIIENERLAHIDSLTHLHNRRAIEGRLDLESTLEQEYEVNLVLYIDLDHFKSINDVYGHSFGDEVLKGCARLLRASIRDDDYAVRLGGEEFCVVCRNFNLDKAEEFAERMRDRIAKLEFYQEELDEAVKVTASFGMTNQLPNEAFDDTLERADRLLYQAKQNGRDRVVYEWAEQQS